MALGVQCHLNGVGVLFTAVVFSCYEVLCIGVFFFFKQKTAYEI